VGFDELPKYQEILERHVPPGTGEPDDPYQPVDEVWRA